MKHLSEVVRILEAALRHDPKKASDYALLLASKLEKDGEERQARAIKGALAKSPAPAYATASFGSHLPKDRESQLHTVDYLQPSELSDDLALHPFVKERVEDFVQTIHSFPKWESLGVATPARLLLYGPPGTGKTSIARQIASDLSLPLITARSDTLVSSLLGQTSRNLRQVFEYSESFPCVLFLDEFDALAKNRADLREVGELQRVVIALLQNIDALSKSTILIAATNHEALLDTAVWRRFEHQIRVELPNPAERRQIWMAKFGDFPISEKDLDQLVKHSDGMSGAGIQTAAFDMVREANKYEPPSSAPLAVLMRRLARILWNDRYNRFDSKQTELISLRSWAPEVYTIRVLSSIFGISIRQVSNLLKGELSNEGPEPDFAATREPGGVTI